VRRTSWLGITAIGLATLLMAVSAVQWRQLTLLEQSVSSGDDYVVLQIYQAESEYLRLREQWMRALDERQSIDAETLRLRYEIWLSRVDLLHNDSTGRLLALQPDFHATLQRIDAFVARANPVFDVPENAAPSRAALVGLTPELTSLGAPLHTLTLDVAHGVSLQIAQRNLAVRQHNRIGIGLTLFLSALTLAFALVALRQLRQLEDRRITLEGLAADLRLARRDADAANQAKSAFLANMSHEIRTPFHGLLGMLSLLQKSGLTPRQVDHLRTATESANHLLAILDDILDVSQLESGRLTLTPVATDLRQLLNEVLSLMRPPAEAKGLTLNVVTAPAVPARVIVDPTRLRQILFNLLSNAIKFSDSGTVLLEVTADPSCAITTDPPRAALEFRVSDTGIGMDEATLAGLFTRFAQGDNSRSRRHGGSGLGLEISRSLARLMGGDITVSSEPGVGSVFSLHLALQPVDDEPALSVVTAPLDQPRAVQALAVLVAEDHPVNRQYMEALLASMGHRVHFAHNGEQAAQAAREATFDLVLMDLHMPVMDGLAATRAIRELPDARAATVPIVALTADAYPETRNRCLTAGMNDYLTKPVSPQSLATCIRRLFGSSAAGVPGPSGAAAASPPMSLDDGSRLIDAVAIDTALAAMPRESLGGMIHETLDRAPQTVARFRAALRDAQTEDLRSAAHAARGAALNLGLSALAATAASLQDGAAHLPAHEIARLVQRFEDLLPLTREAVLAAGLTPPARR
jgi:signal transduction histidine kinase/ActR/RegA family two-component response regulator/HPt (histidine-containing phosphotransfer) domain-containing protein